MSRIYTTKTPSLKAHIADVRNINAKVIDAKKIKLNGENLEDLLNNTDGKITSVRHPNDNREVITENDLWGSTAEIKDGEIIFHNDYVNAPDYVGCSAWNPNLTKVVNNKAYESDNLYANLETGKLLKGDSMFCNNNKLIVFDSDLSSLISGRDMFNTSTELRGSEFYADNCYGIVHYNFTTNMSNLQDGAYMFYLCTKLESFTGDLSSVINGECMFRNCSNLTEFKSNLGSLTNGYLMFYACSSLKGTYVEGDCSMPGCYLLTLDLGSLMHGYSMFRNCSSILSLIITDMSLLQDAYSMFRECSNMESFKCDNFGLHNADNMFCGCTKLTEFNVDMSKVTSGSYTFEDCESLEKFDSNLESLQYGYCMFRMCSSLKHFSSDLSSLADGDYMFEGCRLDTDSLTIIADTIKNWDFCADQYRKITVGIGHIATDKDRELCEEMVAKGWAVELQYYDSDRDCTMGECFSSTLEEDEGMSITVMQPYYAKPVETTQKRARFVSQDGKYYNIAGGNEIFGDDLSTYGMFISKENAEEMIVASLGLNRYTYEPESQLLEEEIETA